MDRVNIVNWRTGEVLSKEASMSNIEVIVEGKCFFCGGLLYPVQREIFPLNPELRAVTTLGRCDECWMDFKVESHGGGLRLEVWERPAPARAPVLDCGAGLAQIENRPGHDRPCTR